MASCRNVAQLKGTLLKKHLVLAARAQPPLCSRSFAPGLAGAAAAAPPAPRATVYMKEVKGALEVRRPGRRSPGRRAESSSTKPTRKKSARTPSRWSPKGSLPKTPNARKNCFTPKHICMSIAKWHGFNPKTEKITDQPGRSRARRLEHARQTTRRRATPGSPAKRKTAPRHPAGDRGPGDDADALLHLRDPSLDAGQDHGPAAPAPS